MRAEWNQLATFADKHYFRSHYRQHVPYPFPWGWGSTSLVISPRYIEPGAYQCLSLRKVSILWPQRRRW